MTDQFVDANKMVPESSMSDLSPAAKAVLDAYKDARDGQYVNGEWIQDEAGQAAAALRAAADQVVPEEDVDEAEYHCLQAKWAAEGEQDARMRFLALAAELEGANG